MLNMQELHDFNYLKNESPEYLYNLIHSIPEGYLNKLYNDNKDLYWYQKISLYIHTMKKRRFIHSFHMGLGKTLLFLAIHEYYTKNKLVKNPVTLYVTHAALSVRTNIPLSIIQYTNSHYEYLNQYNSENPSRPGTILLTTYQGMASTFKDDIEQNGKKTWVYNEERIRNFSNMVDIFVFDEVHWLKSRDSLYFTIANLLVNGRHPPTKNKKKHIFLPGYENKVVMGLTGTLMNKNPIDLWSPSHLIDEGDTFGTYNEFVHNFFIKNTRYSKAAKTTLHKLELKPGSQKILNNRLNNILVYRGSENLPPLTFADPNYYYLAPELKTAYNKIISNQYVFDEVSSESIIDDEDESFKNVPEESSNRVKIKNSIMKLMQVCSGWIYYYSQELNKKGIPLRKVKELISDAKNPKLAAISELLEEQIEYSSKKTVIMYVFQHTGVMLNRYLLSKKHKIYFAGKHLTKKQKTEVIESFKADEDYKAILIGPVDSIGESIELPEADKIIYFENSLSLITKGQGNSRIVRAGHAKWGDVMTIFEIIASNTIEEKNLKSIREGKDLTDTIFYGSNDKNDISEWILK